ncbi:extracellular solute-binding protein [Kaarinaea lacus]
MLKFKYFSFCLLVFLVTYPFTPAIAQNQNLKIFAINGLDKPLSELAGIYKEKHGVNIEIVSGAASQAWIKQAQKTGDIIVCGAEYQLNQILRSSPGLIDKASRTSLYPRMSGILVRKGSNKKIASFSDLGQPNLKLIVVDGADQSGLWEDMTAKREMVAKIQNNILVSAKSNTEAIEQWNSNKDLDAWITFQSWHYYVKGSAHLIKVLDHYKRLRGTPVAIMSKSKNKFQAQKFIEFLKAKENLNIYQKWGW